MAQTMELPEVSETFSDAQREDLFERVRQAEQRLAGKARPTPLLSLDALAANGGGAGVAVKCENLQHTGAFKFRGAYNALTALRDAGSAENGVLTYSSGNHGQALAMAGAMLGIEVTVVMPSNVPAVKREATEARGAKIVQYDPATTRREALGAQLAAERGLPIIPPYDHLDVIGGQATVGLEILKQAPDVARILVCTGGGGLLSGIATAVAMSESNCQVIGVEPALADDATRSFRSKRLCWVDNPPTIADGTRTPFLGQHTFPVVMNLVHDMVTVSEDAIMQGMRLLFRQAKLVVEPSGALGTAALIEGAVGPLAPDQGRTVAVISGGNVDASLFAAVLEGRPLP
ncbi:MAG: pyridoxal-phosphate dependent enzyme [Pseudomonadota bacterium]